MFYNQYQFNYNNKKLDKNNLVYIKYYNSKKKSYYNNKYFKKMLKI